MGRPCSSQFTTTVLFTDRWSLIITRMSSSVMRAVFGDSAGELNLAVSQHNQGFTVTPPTGRIKSIRSRPSSSLRAIMDSVHVQPPDGKARVEPPSQPCTTVMRFSVRVPVLSLQMSVALPIVSHAASTRIRFWSFNILRVEYAREMVTASGCAPHKHTHKHTPGPNNQVMLYHLFTPRQTSRSRCHTSTAQTLQSTPHITQCKVTLQRPRTRPSGMATTMMVTDVMMA